MLRMIRYTREAARQMDALSTTVRETIEAKLNLLATDPGILSNRIKRLKGSPALRLRIGDYRIIFTDDGLILDILKVGVRGAIYR